MKTKPLFPTPTNRQNISLFPKDEEMRFIAFKTEKYEIIKKNVCVYIIHFKIKRKRLSNIYPIIQKNFEVTNEVSGN